jgi:hypothetical protein
MKEGCAPDEATAKIPPLGTDRGRAALGTEQAVCGESRRIQKWIWPRVEKRDRLMSYGLARSA